MKVTQDIAILGGKRTAMAEYCGSGPEYGKFKDLTANDLGSHAIRAALADAKVDPKAIGHVVMGNAMQTSVDAHYGARHAALKAGIPIETPALTVNRICGSGAQAVVNASQMMLLGEHDITVAGGMESMSQAPFFIPGNVARVGIRFGQQPVFVDYLFQGLHDPFCNFFMAQTADNASKKYDVTRDAADKFALRSHQLGAKAAAAGRFKAEIVPVKVKQGRNEITVEADDHIRPETTGEALAKLRPAFGEGGLVTAGNASGIVDGAAALVLANSKGLKTLGTKPRAFVRGWSVAGVDPALMSLGPVPSIAGVLKDTGLSMKDIDLVEINEAFAPQVVACVNALKKDHNIELPQDKLNVNGGAVSLGHPLGATGARLILTLVHELEARKGKYGIASMCIGGGQGIAVLIERA
ncbi:MAG: thiolase family protein [Planctomycetes bacterium]|nr:thiolase family protein [Planctomycetota bacterium]